MPKIYLAPLAGCSDLAFRLICREYGAKFAFFEMVDAHSLIYESRQTFDVLETCPEDKPIAAQLLGCDPDIMLKAAKRLLAIVKVSSIDVNAACPVTKVIKKKCGAYLMRDPSGLYKTIKKLVSSLDIPITVKLRSGFEMEDHKKLVSIAKNCEKHGAATIFIHGRTRSQLYSGDVDYEAIRLVKENVKVPVFGSGNVFNHELAKKMFDETGCDGLLVARGAFGNPWIFRQIKTYLTEGILLPTPNLQEKLAMLTKHLQYIEKYKQTSIKVKVGIARKVAIWYLKGFEHAAMLRDRVGRAQNLQELFSIIDELR